AQSVEDEQRTEQHPDRNGHHDDFRQVQTENRKSQVQRNSGFHNQVEYGLELIRTKPYAGNNANSEQKRLPELVGNVAVQHLDTDGHRVKSSPRYCVLARVLLASS